MYKHLLAISLFSIIVAGCSTSKSCYIEHRQAEKDRLLYQTNKAYSDASILGAGATLIKNRSSLSDFLDSAKNIEGVEVDEASGIVRMSQSVLFDFDSYKVRGEAVQPLSQLLEVFQNQRGATKLLITGHTDNIGSPAYNDNLSRLRAQAVASVLKDLGLDESQIAIEGLGASKPITSNSNEQGRSQNRRVEFKLI